MSIFGRINTRNIIISNIRQ